MRNLLALLLFAVSVVAQETPPPQLPAQDAIRIKEFYRLASAIQDGIWPNWSKVPAPLMLVTSETEFLTHHPEPPKEMRKAGERRSRPTPISKSGSSGYFIADSSATAFLK